MTEQLAAPHRGDFSVHDCDPYIDHLVRVSARYQRIVATRDVRTQSGSILLLAGTPLGPNTGERLRGHRLAAPVDELFTMNRRLGAEDVLECLASAIDAEADLRRIDEHFAVVERMRDLWLALDLRPALLQKLSVMRLSLPRVFHRALFASWFGALVASERGLPDTDIELVFQASLLHDLGLLHIPPALAERKTQSHAGDWAVIQSHAEIGAQVLAQTMDAPEQLLQVLREHHERHDGAGYPGGGAGPDLDKLSPIVALADMLHTLRFHAPQANCDNLADLLPYLRVNRWTFGEENYAPAARILHKARDPQATGTGAPATSVAALLEANRSLTGLLAHFLHALPEIEALPESRATRSLVHLVQHLQWTTLNSGLGNEELEKWLGEALTVDGDQRSLADIQSTAWEIFWLVRRLDRQLRALLDARPDTPASLQALSGRVGAEIERARSRFERDRTAR